MDTQREGQTSSRYGVLMLTAQATNCAAALTFIVYFLSLPKHVLRQYKWHEMERHL
jgi:hypothetical protein